MSKLLPDQKREYDIDDIVSFDFENYRLKGTVVRVYNSGDLFHIEVNGQRYEVDLYMDDMRLVQKSRERE